MNEIKPELVSQENIRESCPVHMTARMISAFRAVERETALMELNSVRLHEPLSNLCRQTPRNIYSSGHEVCYVMFGNEARDPVCSSLNWQNRNNDRRVK